MFLIKDGAAYDTPIKTYYVESEAELTDIPAEAPAGTIVEVNASTGFKVFMKNSQGEFNEL
jgi:hypothetical protein